MKPMPCLLVIGVSVTHKNVVIVVTIEIVVNVVITVIVVNIDTAVYLDSKTIVI